MSSQTDSTKNSFELQGYGKSVRRLMVASVIIGSAIWYSGHLSASANIDADMSAESVTLDPVPTVSQDS